MNSAQSDIRTYPSKGLIIFLLIVIAFSIGAIVLTALLLLKDNLALSIILWLFCGVFLVLSLIVLLFEAINYLSLDENNKQLIIHKFLIKKKIPANEISGIENNEGFYIFHQGKKELYRIGTQVQGANTLIVKLERWGIKIKW